MEYVSKRKWMDPDKVQKFGLLSESKYSEYGQAMILALLIFLLIISIVIMALYLFVYTILFWDLGVHAG